MTHLHADDILDLLRGLVDKSLVVYEEQNGVGRYRLLETVRQYGRGKLTEGGEAEVVQKRAASWFLALAEEAEPHLTGSEQGAWLERLEREHDNLRAALDWYEQPGNDTVAGLRLAGALSRFWHVRGYWSEGRQHLGRVLKTAGEQAGTGEPEASALRAKVLNRAGVLARFQGDYVEARALQEKCLIIQRQRGDQRGIAEALISLGIAARFQGNYAGARALFEESLTIQRQLGDQGGIAASMTNLGSVALSQGDYAGAQALNEESLTLFRQLGDQGGTTASLINLGIVAFHQGDYAGARALYQEGLTLRRQLGHQGGIANVLNNLGNVACHQDDYAEARALFEESLSLCRKLEDHGGIAMAMTSLGNMAFRQGDYAAARSLFEESLTICREVGDQNGIAEILDGMAGVAQGQNQPSRAAQLGGIAAALRESIGSPPSPAEQAKVDLWVAGVRAALGEEAFAAAWGTGRAMTMNEAIKYALETTIP